MNQIKKALIVAIAEWPIWLISLVVGVMYFPARYIEFSWVDDGYVFYSSKKLLDNLLVGKFSDVWTFLIEYGVRFRPTYWFWQAGNYLLSGFDPKIYYFWHFVVVLLIVLLLFKIVKYYSRSNLIGLFASILFVVNPVNTENWYRLGPQEPLIALLVLISFIAWKKYKRPLIGGLIFLVAILTKEPVVALLTPLILIYLYELIIKHKRNREIEKFVLFGMLGFCLIVLPRVLQPLNISSDYQINVNIIFANFIRYIDLLRTGFSPYLEISLLIYFARLLWRGRIRFSESSKSLYVSSLCLLFVFAYLLILSPWGYVIYRYLLPATMFLVIFISLQMKIIFSRLGTTIFVIFMGLFLIQQSYNLLLAHNYGVSAANSTRSIQSFYRHVANTATPNSNLLLNLPHVLELSFETQLQLDKFYNRSDIKVAFLNLDQLPKGSSIIASTSMVTSAYSEEQIATVAAKFIKKSIVVNGQLPILTPPRQILKQVIKKAYYKIVNNEPITLDGIYTTYKINNSWTLQAGTF